MATRPAGSGVLVTLVVFVLTTVAFMVAFVVVLGQSSAAIDDLQKIKDTNKNLNSQLATAKKDAEALAATQTELTTDRDRLKSTVAQQESTLQGTGTKNTIAPFTNATTDYAKSVEEMQKIAHDSKDELEQRYRARIDDLQKNIDGLGAERDTLRTKLEQAEKKLVQFEVKPEDPSSLVDGHIIEVGGPDSTVYLDIGQKHRVVPGMTFEVFSTPEQVQNNKDGALRGKASIQVLRVTDDTSTARVTRSSPNQPVNRNDVLINAVYSPTYTYRMLVYGKFDVNNDGKITAADLVALRKRATLISLSLEILRQNQLNLRPPLATLKPRRTRRPRTNTTPMNASRRKPRTRAFQC